MIWKWIDGYEGYYKANENGDIKSVDRVIRKYNNGKEVIKKGDFLKITLNKDGYRCVRLSKQGKTKTYTAHRLIAKTFLDNPMNKEEVNHKDGNRSNNKVDNLEWVTRSENILHSYRFGKKNNKGENNGRSKLTRVDVEKIKEMKQKGVNGLNISKIFGVSNSTIYRVINNKVWGDVNQ